MTTKFSITCKKEMLLRLLSLNKNDLKIALLILSHINPIEDKWIWSKRITFPKKLIIDKLWIKNNKFYSEIKKITSKLNTTLVYSNKKDEGYIHSTWIAWANTGEDYKRDLTIEISATLIELFTSLTPPYVTIDLDDIVSLTSRYSIGLFCLIQSDKYKNTKYNHELCYSVDFLQTIFNTSYTYKEFKRSIISIAIEEINRCTNLKLNFNEIKTSKKVTDIIFTIEKNNSVITEKKDDNNESIKNPLLEKLQFYKISSRKSKELLEKFSHDHININLKYAINMIEKWLKIKSQTWYIIKCIEENYSNRKENNAPIIANPEESIKKEIERQEKIEIEISKEDKRKWWESLEDEKQKTLLEEYKVGSQYMDKKEILLTRIYKDFEKEILEKKVNEN